MNINWKLKSFVFTLIDTFSMYKFLYFLQKRVTKNSVVNLDTSKDNWLTHLEHISTIKSPNIIEFGAGKNLAQNIFLSYYVKAQTVVDLFPMLDLNQFNEAALKISKLLKVTEKKVSTINQIKEKYNIQYIAPFNLLDTPFTENSFDACISTNTLEHIPYDEIIKTFEMLRFIVKPGGLISAIIDYSDHYSHTDKKISPLNFLSFNSNEFEKYNHKVHFQNRLRHYDFEDIFNKIGFRIMKKEFSNKAALPSFISSDFDLEQKSLSYTRGIFLMTNLK